MSRLQTDEMSDELVVQQHYSWKEGVEFLETEKCLYSIALYNLI